MWTNESGALARQLQRWWTSKSGLRHGEEEEERMTHRLHLLASAFFPSFLSLISSHIKPSSPPRPPASFVLLLTFHFKEKGKKGGSSLSRGEKFSRAVSLKVIYILLILILLDSAHQR